MQHGNVADDRDTGHTNPARSRRASNLSLLPRSACRRRGIWLAAAIAATPTHMTIRLPGGVVCELSYVAGLFIRTGRRVRSCQLVTSRPTDTVSRFETI